MKRLLLVCLLLGISGIFVVGRLYASGNHRSMPARVIIKLVAGHYHESHPRVVQLQTTRTDSTPHEKMYFIELSGHFRRGARRAKLLYFSALADRWYVWGVQGYDAAHHQVWLDTTLPRPHG